jgi:hypothetical protein
MREGVWGIQKIRYKVSVPWSIGEKGTKEVASLGKGWWKKHERPYRIPNFF